MKRILISVVFCLLTLASFSNAAMPGLWHSGHGGRFIPLFKADSIHLGKIQMQRELVLINLYPGFAAVKGEYWMRNTTDKPITMRVGYPVNGQYPADKVDHVMFRDLYNIKAAVDDQPLHIVKATEGYDSVYKVIDRMQMENWYYFTCTFAPQQLTKITVYFLTNNNEAQLSRGYSKDQGNAFAYILETGRAWRGKIEKGEVLIKLNDGLSLSDFRGIYPLNTLYGDEKHLRLSFTGLEPDSSNNILLWYTTQNKNFSFAAIAADVEKYFKALDEFPVKEFETGDFTKTDKDDFEPHDKSLQWVGWLLIGLLVIGVGVLVFVITLIYRLIKRKRKKMT